MGAASPHARLALLMVRSLAPLLVVAALVGVCDVSSVAAAPGGAGASHRVRIYAPRGDPGRSCTRVFALERVVRGQAVLTGAIRALLAGPTATERRRGYGGWFSRRTAGMLRSVRIFAGVAYVDFRDFSRAIPNASTSCGSALLLAQLDRTATQFPSVRRAVYSFGGSRAAFYEWLQREAR
jgi:hypothetical protein